MSGFLVLFFIIKYTIAYIQQNDSDANNAKQRFPHSSHLPWRKHQILYKTTFYPIISIPVY